MIFESQAKCHFLPGEGSRKLGGSGTFSQIKRRIKRFFSNWKGEITYIFKKKQNILLNIVGAGERDCKMQLGDENSNGTF